MRCVYFSAALLAILAMPALVDAAPRVSRSERGSPSYSCDISCATQCERPDGYSRVPRDAQIQRFQTVNCETSCLAYSQENCKPEQQDITHAPHAHAGHDQSDRAERDRREEAERERERERSRPREPTRVIRGR